MPSCLPGCPRRNGESGGVAGRRLRSRRRRVSVPGCARSFAGLTAKRAKSDPHCERARAITRLAWTSTSGGENRHRPSRLNPFTRRKKPITEQARDARRLIAARRARTQFAAEPSHRGLRGAAARSRSLYTRGVRSDARRAASQVCEADPRTPTLLPRRLHDLSRGAPNRLRHDSSTANWVRASVTAPR